MQPVYHPDSLSNGGSPCASPLAVGDAAHAVFVLGTAVGTPAVPVSFYAGKDQASVFTVLKPYESNTHQSKTKPGQQS